MSHAIKLSEAFELVDSGADKRYETKINLPIRGGEKHGSSADNDKDPDKTKTEPGKKAPVCPFGLQKSKGFRYWLEDCNACSDEEK